MLSVEQLKPYYPESLHSHERFILREYLQYRILEIIFESSYANKLAFLGGTCLRIVHNSSRFSEDLDFDNFNLSMEDFSAVTEFVRSEMEKQGCEVEIRNVKKGAYHCYVRFPNILFQQGLSGHLEEKILIRIDTEAQGFEYHPEQPLLNRFDVFTQINATPKAILLAQKFYAVVNRKRNKGRDFFDIVFLLGLGQTPDYDYLKLKIGVNDSEALRARILDRCSQLNMQEMADDVRPFLFDPKDEKRILLFAEYMKQVKLS